jgi:hypothetical protein
MASLITVNKKYISNVSIVNVISKVILSRVFIRIIIVSAPPSFRMIMLVSFEFL